MICQGLNFLPSDELILPVQRQNNMESINMTMELISGKMQLNTFRSKENSDLGI